MIEIRPKSDGLSRFGLLDVCNVVVDDVLNGLDVFLCIDPSSAVAAQDDVHVSRQRVDRFFITNTFVSAISTTTFVCRFTPVIDFHWTG